MEYKELLKKWLRVLFYINLISMIQTVVESVTNLGIVGQWITKILAVVTFWCFFQLKDTNPRYRKAAIFSALVFICGLIMPATRTASFGITSALVLAGSTFGWIVSYQVYHAHGEIAAQWDAKLGKKWSNLFTWEILVSLAVSAVSVFGTTLLIAMDNLSGSLTTVILVLSTILNLFLEGLYLLYMVQTLKLLEE